MRAYWFYMPLVFVWMLTGCTEADAGWTPIYLTLAASAIAAAVLVFAAWKGVLGLLHCWHIARLPHHRLAGRSRSL